MPFPAPARTLLYALAALAPLASAQSAASSRVAWNRPVAPFNIVGPVYYVGAAGVASFLITTPHGHFLIDGGFSETAPLIERNIATLGFRLHDVKFLLNTHAHFDHAGGLAALHRATGAPLAVSAPDAAVISSGAASLPAVPVARILADGDSLTLGALTLTAHLTPGHTKGCTTWTLPVPSGGSVLHVLFFCSASVVAPLVHNAAYPSIADDYRRTFAAARLLPCDVFLAPHPFQFQMEEKLARRAPGAPNPFIDPAEFPRYLAQAQADFERELKAQSAARRR